MSCLVVNVKIVTIIQQRVVKLSIIIYTATTLNLVVVFCKWFANSINRVRIIKCQSLPTLVMLFHSLAHAMEHSIQNKTHISSMHRIGTILCQKVNAPTWSLLRPFWTIFSQLCWLVAWLTTRRLFCLTFSYLMTLT